MKHSTPLSSEFPIHELLPHAYPHLWLHIPRPARRLFVQGLPQALFLLDRLPSRGLAIVGTRHPTLQSTQRVQKNLRPLKKQDFVIISGLARGIDRCAHQSALDNHLKTIAILGTPLESSYPSENLDLKTSILHHGGLLVSEFPPGTETRPWHFPLRNRWIAGWAQAIWMVEAPQRSGALNTLQWALQMPEKNVYVTPCAPDDPSFAGNQIWLQNDPSIQPFWNTQSLGSTWLELGALRPAVSSHSHAKQPLTSDARMWLMGLQQLGAQHQTIDASTALDHFLDRPDWDARRFFAAAQESIQKGYIQEEYGGWKIFYSE